jgi:hypothetical protein
MGNSCSCLHATSESNLSKQEEGKVEVNSDLVLAKPEEVTASPPVPLAPGLVLTIPEASSLQSVLRGYLSRKHIHEPLFNLREARAWLHTIQAKYEIVDQPIADAQHRSVGRLEKKLAPLTLERPADGVKVRAMPPVKLDDGRIYEGEWDKDGNQHGLGTMITADGSKIVGVFKEGQVDGMGRMIQSSGIVLEGQFKDGELHGNATIQAKKGAKFEGEVKAGKMDGKGTEEWPDGIKYEGEYKGGLKHGKGTLIMPDGSKYTGQFKKNNIEGKGTMEYKNGNKYTGKWKNGKMNGYGVFEWADRRVYEGEFKDDIRHGNGKLTYPDGRVYDGEWVEGKQHGEANSTFLGKDGQITTKRGVWEDGNRVKWV